MDGAAFIMGCSGSSPSPTLYGIGGTKFAKICDSDGFSLESEALFRRSAVLFHRSAAKTFLSGAVSSW